MMILWCFVKFSFFFFYWYWRTFGDTWIARFIFLLLGVKNGNEIKAVVVHRVVVSQWYWLGLTHLCLGRGWHCSCHSQWRWCHESPLSASLRSEFVQRLLTGSDWVCSVSTGWSICSWSCGLILYSSWTQGLRDVTVIRRELGSTDTVCWLSKRLDAVINCVIIFTTKVGVSGHTTQ